MLMSLGYFVKLRVFPALILLYSVFSALSLSIFHESMARFCANTWVKLVLHWPALGEGTSVQRLIRLSALR